MKDITTDNVNDISVVSDIPQLDGAGYRHLTAYEINPCADLINMWYQCEHCEYHSSTASGLVKHKKKKHKM